VENVIELLRNFQISKTKEFYDQQTNIQLILFIYALFIMGAFLSYIWVSFVKYLGDQIFNTRQIMGLFPMETILLNPYMVAFLERARRR
jgi:hypothetical protein